MVECEPQIETTPPDVPPDSAASWLHKLYAVAAGPPAYREDICAAVFDAAAIVQPSDARVFLELAARLTPRQPELHLCWARQLQHRPALGLAIAMCDAAFAADGDIPELHRARGQLLRAAGYHDAAAQDLAIAANALGAAAPLRRMRRLVGRILRPLF